MISQLELSERFPPSHVGLGLSEAPSPLTDFLLGPVWEAGGEASHPRPHSPGGVWAVRFTARPCGLDDSFGLEQPAFQAPHRKEVLKQDPLLPVPVRFIISDGGEANPESL